MRWSWKWRKEISNGLYWKMLQDGAIKKEEDKAPVLGPFEFYIEAFEELDTARPVGMGIGPIPFTALIDYCRIYEIDKEDFEVFRYLVRRLDSLYLSLREEERKKDERKSKNGNKQTNRNRG